MDFMTLIFAFFAGIFASAIGPLMTFVFCGIFGIIGVAAVAAGVQVNILGKVSKKTIQKLHFDSWAYIAVSLSFLFAVLFLLYHFSNNTPKKRLYFITGTMSFILMLFSVFFAYKANFITNNKLEAIIFAQQTTIKVAPILSSETAFKLHEGTKVFVLETMDNWKKIKVADGQTGWIISSELKEL